MSSGGTIGPKFDPNAAGKDALDLEIARLAIIKEQAAIRAQARVLLTTDAEREAKAAKDALKASKDVARAKKEEANIAAKAANDALKASKDAARAKKEEANSAEQIGKHSARSYYNTRAMRTLFHEFTGNMGGPVGKIAREYELVHRAGGSTNAVLLAGFNLIHDGYEAMKDLVKEQRNSYFTAAEASRVMGGSVDSMQKMTREAANWDDLLNSGEGWTQNMFHELEMLGVNGKNTEVILGKLHQAMAWDNYGVERTKALSEGWLTISRRALEIKDRGGKAVFNQMQLQEIFGKNRYVLKDINKYLKDHHKTSLDIKEVNEAINGILKDNTTHTIDPERIRPAWQKFGDFIKTDIYKILDDFSKHMNTVLDPASYEQVTVVNGGKAPAAPSVLGFLSYLGTALEKPAIAGAWPADTEGETAKQNNIEAAKRHGALKVDQMTYDADLMDRGGSEAWQDTSGSTVAMQAKASIATNLDSFAEAFGLKAADGFKQGMALPGHASGGIVTGISGGFANVQPASGEGLASIGLGERIVPAGVSGGGGGINIGNVNFGGTSVQTNEGASAKETGESLGAAQAMTFLNMLIQGARQVGAQ
jgi:hypothetical protein